ncbi:MAG: hypothetical protein K5669_02420 [Lachnospiraceae bacterium]|nr:hypothetical protein [Lachnospiraceae bacterium]
MKKFIKTHLHTLLILAGILLIIGLVAFIVLRFTNFINFVTIDKEISDEAIASYTDNNDIVMPVLDKDGYILKRDVENILILGNGPFALDKDSKNGLAAMLADKTGANVINCALPGTYACQIDTENILTNPMDVYSPYYLAMYKAFPEAVSEQFDAAYKALGSDNPEGAKEVLDTLSSLDMSTVQVLVLFYDLTDYYMDHPRDSKDAALDEGSFGGNIYRTVHLFNAVYPEVRIIVMSPYYNPAKDDNGNEISAELVKNSYGNPSAYVYAEIGTVQSICTASFMDNYFGSITEDNYTGYLNSDGRTLNKAGRELMTKRLVSFITAFK